MRCHVKMITDFLLFLGWSVPLMPWFMCICVPHYAVFAVTVDCLCRMDSSLDIISLGNDRCPMSD